MSDDAVADLALNQRGGARRREDIVEAARQAGTLVVADLPGQVGVSPETTHRRDDFLVHRAGAFATPGTHHYFGGGEGFALERRVWWTCGLWPCWSRWNWTWRLLAQTG